MAKLSARISYVRVTDEDMLRQVGCPWATATLRQFHYEKKHPGLINKVGGLLMLDVAEMERILAAGRSVAPTGA